MSHTKGPWSATLAPRLNVKGSDKKSICAIVAPAGKQTRSYEEHCANAKLIAAAPDLLSALQGLVTEAYESGVIEYLPDDSAAKEIYKNRLKAAEQAINKAKP